ncbi:MAG: DnaJ C-terminal domain-containing protein [Pseudomonadota bacterium]
MQDPYKTLGVSKTASDDEVKSAYRKLVKKLHPDVNPNSPEVEQRFKDVGSAYAIIGDPEKRAKFDKGQIDADGRERPDFAFQQAWTGGQRAGGPFGGRTGRTSGGFDAHDIFEDLFGRGGAGTRGADVTYELKVDFLDAALGARRDMVLSDGRIVSVTIPAGAENGQTLRLRGQGMAGMRGAKAGDALINLTVRDHPFFERKGNDIHLNVPITLKEAVLGASIEVPTIGGKVSVKVPPNSSSGTALRLRGKGINDRKSGDAGAQLIRLEIVLDETPDAALREFADSWDGPKQNPRVKKGLL